MCTYHSSSLFFTSVTEIVYYISNHCQQISLKIKFINDIDIDHFGWSVDRLGTTSVSTCVGFIVILNDGQDLFVEHRSDAFFSSNN
jgi:hypothetical protein